MKRKGTAVDEGRGQLVTPLQNRVVLFPTGGRTVRQDPRDLLRRHPSHRHCYPSLHCRRDDHLRHNREDQLLQRVLQMVEQTLVGLVAIFRFPNK